MLIPKTIQRKYDGKLHMRSYSGKWNFPTKISESNQVLVRHPVELLYTVLVSFFLELCTVYMVCTFKFVCTVWFNFNNNDSCQSTSAVFTQSKQKGTKYIRICIERLRNEEIVLLTAKAKFRTNYVDFGQFLGESDWEITIRTREQKSCYMV